MLRFDFGGPSVWRPHLESDGRIWYDVLSVASATGHFLLSICGGLTSLANSKSSKKRIRVAERRREENKPLRTEARTLVKKAEAAIASGDRSAAEAAILEAVSVLDRVADKDVVHKNNAARRKSRLMAKYHALEAASA